MSPSCSVSFIARTSLSALRARAAVLAPVFSAAFSLSSFAHAEAPPAEAATVEAAAPTSAAPTSAAPTPITPPSVTAPSAAPPAVTPPSAASTPPAPVSADHPTAQPARVHQGFYLRFGSGPSVASLSGHGPSGSASLTGAAETGFIAIGGAVAPGLVLAGTLQGTGFSAKFKGGPLAGASLTSDGETRSASQKAQAGLGMLGLLLDWYPQPRAGWHAGVATGIGVVGITNLADDSNLGGVNLSGSVFGGYDWALGRDWSLGLQLMASGGTATKLLEDPDAQATGYRLTPVSLGVQASLLYF